MSDTADTYNEMNKLPREKSVFPVIHVTGPDQALAQTGVAFDCGADGVFLIDHDVSTPTLLRIFSDIRVLFPSKFIGINCLRLSPSEVFGEAHPTTSAIWCDNAMISEGVNQSSATAASVNRRHSRWRGLYFGGVAFKYQSPVRDVAQAAHNAMPAADIVSTLRETLDDFERRDVVSATPSIVTIGKLIADNPSPADPVIDGLLRRGETMNIVADPKRGKSWLAYGLALSVATGLDWLGRYPCEPGHCLIIDNELHLSTLANRIPKVAVAMGIQESDYRPHLDVLSLRGRLTDFAGINRLLSNVERGFYNVIVLDAFYRALPEGVSENENAQITGIYNLIDQMTGRIDSGWANILHTSKGNQSGKSVTDTGAGAGSQSRAADTHLVLRPHQEPGVIVLEAAVRSFKPVQPFTLKFEFPLWLPAMEYDPKKLAGLFTRADERQNSKDEEGIEIIRDALQNGPTTANQLRIGMGAPRVAKLLRLMAKAGTVTTSRTMTKGGETDLYTLVPLESATSSDVVDGVTDGQTG